MAMRFFLFSAVTALLGASVAAAASQTAESARMAAREYGAAVRNCDMAWAVDSMYPPLRRSYAGKLGSRNEAAMASNIRRFKGEEKEETAAQAAARMAANEKALRAQYTRMGEQMKAQGVRIESYTVGEPFAEYVVTPPAATVKAVQQDKKAKVEVQNLDKGRDRSRLVVLPTTLVVSAPDANGTRSRVERRSHIFAVRDEAITETGRARGTVLNKWYFIDSKTDVNTLRTFFPDLPLNLRLPASGDRVLR